MVFILSTEADHTTSDVIDWLIYFNQTYCRINDQSSIKVDWVKLQANGEVEIVLNCEGEQIRLSQIQAYWYRRGKITLDLKPLENHPFSNKINQYLQQEGQHLIDFIYEQLEQKEHTLGKFSNNYLNKLQNLKIAQEVGFEIPESSIYTSIEAFDQMQDKLTKGIHNNISISTPNHFINAFANIYQSDTQETLPVHFFPTLFQGYIDKLYELRIFYLNGDCFTNAIFSQQDAQTRIDYRNYNNERPNRVVPFNLPKHLQKQDSLPSHLIMQGYQ